jgi:glycosyltransferase involved in cell wall biosynthesis
MVRLARDRELASRLGAAGRELVRERFSLGVSARALAAVFRDMGALG